MNMLQVCIFVPFLHAETPKPQNVPKTAPAKEGVVPQANMIREVLNFRIKIGQVQKDKLENKRIQQEIMEQREQNYLNNSFDNVADSHAITAGTKFTVSKDSNIGLKKQYESMDDEPNTQAFPTPRDCLRTTQRD